MVLLRAAAALGLIMATGTGACGDGDVPLPASAPESSRTAGSAASGGDRGATPEIENTHWRLTELYGRSVPAGGRQGEPHLVLRPDRRQASGSGGCNRLFGGYRIEAGGRLRFSALATTRMACPEGMETEREFLKALVEVRTWAITGSDLDLYDATGKPLARFTAR